MMAARFDRKKMISALVPIYAITLIDVVGYFIMIPLLPYLAQRYGASGVLVGALLATMAVASVVAAPIWGALSDRVGRKPVVLISQVIGLIGYLLLAWAPNLSMLFVARGVAGIGGGNIGVTQSYIADVTDEEHRDQAYALFGVVFGIGIVLGPVIGGFLVRYGFWVPFVVSAGIELINITLTIAFLPSTARRQRRAAKLNLVKTARVVFANDEVRSLIIRHFLFIFAVTYFFTIFALFVQRALRMGPEHASWLLAGAGIVGGVMLVAVVGPLARRVGDAVVAQYGFALSAIAYLALGFAHNLWFFVAVLIVWAAGASCVEPTIAALLSESAGPDERGAVMGFNDAMSNVALMTAPSLGGFVMDKGTHLVGIVPGLVVTAALVVGVMHREQDASLAGSRIVKAGEKRATA